MPFVSKSRSILSYYCILLYCEVVFKRGKDPNGGLRAKNRNSKMSGFRPGALPVSDGGMRAVKAASIRQPDSIPPAPSRAGTQPPRPTSLHVQRQTSVERGSFQTQHALASGFDCKLVFCIRLVRALIGFQGVVGFSCQISGGFQTCISFKNAWID